MTSALDQGAFSAVMNFMHLMKGYAADVTTATVTAKAKISPEVPQTLGMGATMKCDGTKIPAECAYRFVAVTLGVEPTDELPSHRCVLTRQGDVRRRVTRVRK